MPRIIFKCPYIKGGSKRAAKHLRHYVSYVATRSGVECVPTDKRDLPATKKQKELVARIVRDFPLSKGMFEYEDYLASPTCGSASEFITRAMEDNYDQVAKLENYMKYIAERPGAQVVESHGLFTASDDPLALSQVADTVANHSGNVWLPIISLRREDAQRVGYDNAEQWRSLLRSRAMDMAEQMRIPWDQFRWYAAYHDTSSHPHVHMVCYSADGKSGFLTEDGIAGIKSMLAKEIFRQELTELYAEQTKRRNALTKDAEAVLKDLVRQMRGGAMENSRIEQLMTVLSQQLKRTSGKKQYGYLKAPLKAVVDEIVDELAKDERVEKAYELWYEMRKEVLHTYRDNQPERPPLSQQKEFKQIKNMVIREAAQLGEQSVVFDPTDESMEEMQPESGEEASAPEPLAGEEAHTPESQPDSKEEQMESEYPPVMEWSDRYHEARSLLFGDDTHPQDFEKAFELFREEALTGNALAMHDLGRMYMDGLGREIDAGQAQAWYAKALDAFQTVESEKPSRYLEYRIGKMYAAGLGTEQSYAVAAEWFSISAGARYKYAQYSLARLYYRGSGVERDYEKALRLYADSARQGFPYAAYELGRMYRDGVGCAADETKAAQYFKSAFHGFRRLEDDSHDDKLQYRIGQMLFDGVGTEKDEAEGRERFEKSAKLGNAYAQYRLAKIILADPDSTPERTAEAIDWLTRAAEAGQDNAQYALGKLYLDGARKDVSKAAEWLKKAAEQGNPYAQYRLGKLYLSGEDLPKDTGKAVRYLTDAADQGNEFAQYALGKLYLKGEDVPKDISKAVQHLTNAADQGNEFAQYALGKLYLTGEEAPKDVDKAVRFLKTAAEQGNQYAQYALGKLYLLGKDIPRDKEEAIRWFTLSAAQGNEYAKHFLDHMDDPWGPSPLLCVTRLLRHMGKIFEDNPPPKMRAMKFTDRKLLRKIREKKMAHGHKADDHEDMQMV